MPVYLYSGNESDEQARGPVLNNGVVKLYLVRRDNPLIMLYVGGHRIDDPPTYNITEGKIVPRYRFLNGRNTVVEEYLSNDVVKSITFNLMLPNRFISVTDRIFQMQQNCEYDLVFVPEECLDGCDEWYWVGLDAHMGAKQITSSIIGFDDNEGPITTMRTVRTAGQLLTHYGFETTVLDTAVEALYSILVVDKGVEPCQGCECEYQTLVRGGANGYLDYSTDGGETWTLIDTTALPLGAIVTDIKYVEGNLVISYSDVHAGTGTAGGFAYSRGIGPAMQLSTLDDGVGVSLGIQTMEILNGKLYGFGTGGEAWLSCDQGINFYTVTNNTIVADIFDSDVDEVNNKIYVGGAGGAFGHFNGSFFVDISADLPGNVIGNDILSVLVEKDGAVAVGTVGGWVGETWDQQDGVANYQEHSFNGLDVTALEGDGRGYRTLVATGTILSRRDLFTRQVFEEHSNILAGDIQHIVKTHPLADEGVNYWFGVTDAGETVRFGCDSLCLDSEC